MKSDSLLKKIGSYRYILPALLVFAAFLSCPFLKTIYLGPYKTSRMGQTKLFVELGNYMELFQSGSFYNSLAVILLFVTIVVAGSMALGLLTTALRSKTFLGTRIFSTAYVLPMATVSSSAAMILKIMSRPSIGIVNKLLGPDTNWVNDPKYALIRVALLTAWLNSGTNFLYFSAGFNNIDETIYERASVNGANGIQKSFRLTLPGLGPIMFYIIVVNTIQASQSFGQMKILARGGLGEPTDLVVYSTYRDAFFNHRFGSAAAQSVIPFTIIMVMMFMMFKAEKKGVSYQWNRQ